MKRRQVLAKYVSLAAVMVSAAFGSRATAKDLLVEWADQPSNPDWLPGRPVFLRTLSCVEIARQDYCELMVINVSRFMCPLNLSADKFDTRSGNLRVLRTDKSVSLEFTDLSNVWNIHLDLTGDPTIVDRASGSVVTKMQTPQGGIRTSDLVALVNDSKFLPSRGFAEVDTNCTKINAVAAKRFPKK
jgi:hypothetical protein